LAVAIPPLAAGQDDDPAGPVRVANQPIFRALGGSVSQARRGEEGGVLGALHLVPASGAFTLTFVTDDAMKCAGPHSVEHEVTGDTRIVTLFDNAPAICPGAFTPTAYTLTVSGLRKVSRIQGGAGRVPDRTATVFLV